VAAGRRRAAEVVTEALACAREHTALGAFWSLAAERALDRANMVDARVPRSAARLPLAGVPLAVKDNLDVTGLATTAGLVGEPSPARRDAAAVRLLETAGAVAIGKTAMDPLGWSTHGQAEGFPPCRNPIDPRLSPGGSSSGSAVAVAAGIVPLGLGTDTAGSLRIPAAFCGIVALKPAWGEVPAEGCLPLAPSFDTVGILGRTVRDCAAAHDVMAGPLAGRPLAVPAFDAAPAAPVGVLADLFEAADRPIASACERTFPGLEAAGIRLQEVRLDWSAPGFGLLLAAELAETWGARAAREPERFPEDILSAIERAQSIDRLRQEDVRSELIAAHSVLHRRMAVFAALLAPTIPVPVPSVEEENVETSTRFTRIFSALGWPALSVPCGIDASGRPVGMQVASARDIGAAVAVAASVELCARRLTRR